jgi:hypothetical protein
MRPVRERITASFVSSSSRGWLFAPSLLDHQLVKLRGGA